MQIIQWRVFAIEKLKGNQEFDILLNSELDWPDVIIKDEREWKSLIEKLKQTQNEIIKLIIEKEDAFLDEKTAGKDYNNLTLLEGVIQHDIYHLGQIGLLNSRIAKKPVIDAKTS